jgi:hypothetical protein
MTLLPGAMGVWSASVDTVMSDFFTQPLPNEILVVAERSSSFGGPASSGRPYLRRISGS